MWGNTPTSYGKMSKILHWTMAVLILGMLSVGFYMTSLPDSDTKNTIYNMHKATGVVVLTILVFRILWRSNNYLVKPVSGLPWLIQKISLFTHVVLYLLMLAMPITGLLMSLFAGYNISVFGLFTIKSWRVDTQAATLFHDFHEALALILAILVCLHILAALYHHFIRKDDTLNRMIK